MIWDGFNRFAAAFAGKDYWTDWCKNISIYSKRANEDIFAFGFNNIYYQREFLIELIRKFLERVPWLTKENKFLMAVVMIFAFSLLSANLFASTMHHTDESDCALQTSCNNCFVSATTDSSELIFSHSFFEEFLKTSSLFESNVIVPAAPPPKN